MSEVVSGPFTSVATEWWTYDARGLGYCSTVSLEDAIRGHFLDMQAVEPLGPIVNVKVKRTKTVTTTTVEETEFWEERKTRQARMF